VKARSQLVCLLLLVFLAAGCESTRTSGASPAPAYGPSTKTVLGSSAPVGIVVTEDDPSMPAGCRPGEVAKLITGFFGAANRGDAAAASRFVALPEGSRGARGGTTVVPEYTVVRAGQRFTARTRGELVSYLRERHERDERLTLLLVAVAEPGSSGRADVAYYLPREAGDLGGERVAGGKAVVDCGERKILRWVMDVDLPRHPKPKLPECPKPEDRGPRSAVVACASEGSGR